MAAGAEKLNRRTKLMYGVGDAGITQSDTVGSMLFTAFLTNVVGPQPGLAAVGLFVGPSSDHQNDPIIGYLSERTRSRWGRRPFIPFGTILSSLVYMMLWRIPPLHSPGALAVYCAAAFVLCDTAATILCIPCFALTPEVATDHDECATLTICRMGFSTAGAMIAFVVLLAIIGTLSPQNASGVEEPR